MDNLVLKQSSYRLKDYDKNGTVIFMANSFNIEDHGGDISLKGSFAKSIGESFDKIRYLFNHDTTRKIGEPLEAWESDEGLIIKAVLNLNKDDGRNTYEDYKLAAEYGKSVDHSVGVIAVKTRGSQPRYVSEWKLVEASYIPVWGMNPHTPLISVKSNDIEFVRYCVKNGNYTDCYHKKYESLLEPPQALEVADDSELINFYNKLKF